MFLDQSYLANTYIVCRVVDNNVMYTVVYSYVVVHWGVVAFAVTKLVAKLHLGYLICKVR